MSKISRIPAGLLGFLGIKNAGQYPSDISQVLLPTWDLASLYLQYGAQLGGDAGTENVAGYQVVATCPPGEVWCLHNIGMSVTTGAGDQWTGGICRSKTSGGTTVPISGSGAISANNNVLLNALAVPTFLTPGETLGLITLSVTGTIDYYLTYRYSILSM